ncbi:hypothetical protein I6F26_10140 [Ensifer sp. IC3342]|nr:hypothetical protein [Ensifer sp. BRP08]MCA1446938.1 hypothetical protein [Ensifer sp. IC3342]
MANKLEINVEADTADAQKGIKDLEKDIEALGKASAESSDVAAKQASLWGDSLASVKDKLPTPADAKGMEAIGDATLTASKSTAIIETRMQRLGRTMSNVGRTLAAGFTRAFAGLGRIALSAGRMIGTALITGLSLTAVGAIVALGLTIYQQFRKILDKVTGAAAAAAETMRSAFAAGLEVSQLRAYLGLGEALGLSAEAASDMAAAIGPLQEKLKAGGEDSKQLAEAIRLLGGDLSKLDPTKAESMARLLASIQESYKQLAPLARQKLLSMMFEGADIATLAAIDQQLMGTKINVNDLAVAVEKYKRAAQESDKWNSAMATAWGNLTTAAGNLYDAWLQLTGLGPAFEQALAALPAMVNALAQHINKVAEIVRNLPQIISDAATQTVAAFKKMFDDLVAAATAGWNAVWNAALGAVKTGIEKVKSAIQSFVDWFNQAMQRMRAASAGEAIGGMIPGQQRQSVPVPFSGGGAFMRSAGAMTTSPYSPFAGRAAPRAANDNGMGGGLVATMDAVLFRWKEYSKEVEKAAATTERAGQTIKTSLEKASVGTDNLASTAEAANDNLSEMDQTAQEMDSAFASWAESAAMGFLDAAMAGEDFRDVLADILKDLAKLVLQQYVLKPLFGGLFPGAFNATAPAGLNADAMTQGGAGLRALSPAEVSGLANIAGQQQAQIGGSTTVNNNVGDIKIDMTTGQVAATTEDGKRLGQQIEKAVQAILIKESKPGGILRQVA